MSNYVDEGLTFKERFDRIEQRLCAIADSISAMNSEGAEFGEKLYPDVRLIQNALGTLLTLMAAKPVLTSDLERLITDLGFRPPSPLLVSSR